MIAGSVEPDTGTFTLNGKDVQLSSPQHARALGIGIFYQELSLSLNRTIAENIFINHLPMKYGVFVDQTALTIKAQQYIDLFKEVSGDNFTAMTKIVDLRADQRQLVEILKALATEADILIFDEPTSALDRAQVERFFSILSDLKRQGRAMIMISHRMDEIFEISDRLTVIRDGQIIATREKKDVEPSDIIQLMVGEHTLPPTVSASTSTLKTPDRHSILHVKDLSGKGFSRVDFSLNRGEILGFGGLHGQGQSAILRAIYGANSIDSGTITVNDTEYNVSHPRAAIAKGCAYVSGNRTYDGVIQGRTILENSTAVYANTMGRFVLSSSQLSSEATAALSKLQH